MRDGEILASIRTLLLLTLAGGMLGIAAELLLIGHFEGIAQWIPLLLLGFGLALAAWHAAAPSAATVNLLKALMTVYIASGVVGIGLHYSGNTAFELELHPQMEGFELLRNTLTGATPVLAPGSMALLGLIGLGHIYEHPAVTTGRRGNDASVEES